ncbi:hypothetical protein EVAR_15788_1 [Eumeta japonica]|uniref:Uncharacterized protein n=1 Tax=Eumeta variegata TaxID=151549 RepID=A0A4C1TZN1_EUMVA|nr:hypothetical protein EVAR_15788_1 [Eumeta japonica]
MATRHAASPIRSSERGELGRALPYTGVHDSAQSSFSILPSYDYEISHAVCLIYRYLYEVRGRAEVINSPGALGDNSTLCAPATSNNCQRPDPSRRTSLITPVPIRLLF